VISLVYSNRSEELAREFGARLRAQQLADGVLHPVRVIVPSPAVQGYLQVRVATDFGIAANIEMLRLTSFATGVVRSVFDTQLAGADAIEAMALTLLLDDEFLALPELAPVQAYLSAGSSRDSRDLRRVQLAARIGRLFEEYTYSRGAMLFRWEQGPTLEPSFAVTEAWQRRLWIAMFGAGGLARSRGLMALHEAVAAWPEVHSLPRRAVHVFGFAHFGTAFHQLFSHIGRACVVVLYSLSPCEGFWEDVEPTDPAPLSLWGRAGREQVRALNEAAGYDHDDRFVAPEGPSLLAQIQRDLLQRTPWRQPVDERRAFEGDESIRVLEHAGIRRELEGVASEIWTLVERDPTLRFDHIVVLLPDGDAPLYLTHLVSVFREAHSIPNRVIDVPGSSLSGPVELALRILALPFGRFTRKEVLGVVLHPSMDGATGDAGRARRVAWCEALGIAHGASHEDHRGTYLERDLFNWDQGLRRLALGAFMAGDASGQRDPFELGLEAYVPLEVAPSDLHDAATFGSLVRSLAADVGILRDEVLPLSDWAALLASFVETYVAPASEAEVEPLAGCLRQVRSLRAFDVGTKPVPYAIAYELLRTRLVSSSASRGGDGVLVSRLRSSHPVPARVAFACGMGEGHFPATDPEDPLDLRRAERLPGDVSARDRDKYAFLECLLGTRDRLYLSYVSREPLTGDTLAPSTVVDDLLHALARSYLRDVSSLVRRHPLRRWDEGYFPDVFATRPSNLGTVRIDEANAEARTVALRRSADGVAARVTPDIVRARAALTPAWRSFAEHLGFTHPSGAKRLCETRLTLPMSVLASFLEWPLQGWARFCIGLDEDELVDIEALEEEPLSTERRDVTTLLRRVWLASRGSDQAMDEAYDSAVRACALRGQGPAGLFAEGERPKQLGTLLAWTREIRKLGAGVKEAAAVHRFGAGVDITPSDEAHPPFGLEVQVSDVNATPRTVHVDLIGRTLPRSPEVFITLSRLPRTDPWANDRAALRAFVDNAVLVAAGAVAPLPYASVFVEGSETGARTSNVEFEPMSREEATTWIAGVVGDLLSGPHDAFLPCEAVFSRHAEDPGGDLVPHLESAREKLARRGRSALRSAFGPVPHPEAYPIPEEAVAREQAERLFGCFYAQRKAGA
jgi:exodeoxyribonuclease V gamma subunit